MIGSDMKLLFAVMTLATAVMAQPPQTTMPQDTQVIPLWSGQAPGAQGNEDRDIPTITVYLPRTCRVPALRHDGRYLCPGRRIRPARDESRRAPGGELPEFAGIAAFVLKYRLGPRYHHPVELGDAQRAIRTVRRKRPSGILRRTASASWASRRAGIWLPRVTHFDAGKPARRIPSSGPAAAPISRCWAIP